MTRVDIEKLKKLQRDPKFIRNVCILAHVDHGKTTLADALVSSNGIISQRMAGKLRYLDSREDEQIRGITMKSSAISLFYKKDSSGQDYLVNLIDSPGHIDFYADVSTVVRICDGAIILIDLVEGICPQTHAVLRQAWLQNIKPVLVFNKLDRLIFELKYTTEEAEIRIQQLLEQVNAITGELFTSEVFAKSLQEASKKILDSENKDKVEVFDWGTGLEDTDDSTLYFSPIQGNVVFASAIDGWGFRLSDFANLYFKKVGVSKRVLNKTLWGDYYLDNKSKQVKKGAKLNGKKTLFVQLILDNIWKVYDTVLIKKDKELIEKIIKTLNLNIVLKHKDFKVTLQLIFTQWLPLSTTVLEMICDQLPNPTELSEDRILNFLKGGKLDRSLSSLPDQTLQLKESFLMCSSENDAPVIIFISKMFPVDKKLLPSKRSKPLTMEEITARRKLAIENKLAMSNTCNNKINLDTKHNAIDSRGVSEKENINTETVSFQYQEDDIFVAFARIFSGTIKQGQTLYAFSSKHDPVIVQNYLIQIEKDPTLCLDTLLSTHNIHKFQVSQLFLLMGRELESLDEVPAGNVFGIGGLEEIVLRSASISNNLFCPTFTDLHYEVSPIVRVAVEPRYAADLDKLVKGLKLLNHSDPSVVILLQETGEHVILAAGEVHLNKCLDDLKQRFARIEINVSSPIVPFRETIVANPIIDRVNEAIDQFQRSKPKKVEHLEKEEKFNKSDRTIHDKEKKANFVHEKKIKANQLQNENLNQDGGIIVFETLKDQMNISLKIIAAPLPIEAYDLLNKDIALIKNIIKINEACNISRISGILLSKNDSNLKMESKNEFVNNDQNESVKDNDNSLESKEIDIERKLLDLNQENIHDAELSDVNSKKNKKKMSTSPLFESSIISDIPIEEQLDILKNNLNISISNDIIFKTKVLYNSLKKILDKSGNEYLVGACDNLWAIAPKRNCTNILINKIPNYYRMSFWSTILASEIFFDNIIVNNSHVIIQNVENFNDLGEDNVHINNELIKNNCQNSIKSNSSMNNIKHLNKYVTEEISKGIFTTNKSICDNNKISNKTNILKPFDRDIINGFEMATESGPLCEEPMSGVCFILLDFNIISQNSSNILYENKSDVKDESLSADKDVCLKAQKGDVKINSMKDLIEKPFETVNVLKNNRLMNDILEDLSSCEPSKLKNLDNTNMQENNIKLNNCSSNSESIDQSSHESSINAIALSLHSVISDIDEKSYCDILKEVLIKCENENNLNHENKKILLEDNKTIKEFENSLQVSNNGLNKNLDSSLISLSNIDQTQQGLKKLSLSIQGNHDIDDNIDQLKHDTNERKLLQSLDKNSLKKLCVYLKTKAHNEQFSKLNESLLKYDYNFSKYFDSLNSESIINLETQKKNSIITSLEKRNNSNSIINNIASLSSSVLFKGSLISIMKEACRKSFQVQPQRLMWPMYTCIIQATSDVLGKMYGVLNKRHGRILSEELIEGSSVFHVTSVLPVIESFGFSDEFRKKTSGLAMPQLKFSHWEVLDIDPYWVPTTDTEYTHFGEKADSENIARKYMNDVRKGKGLKVNEKIVEFAEKQRTLKKNK